MESRGSNVAERPVRLRWKDRHDWLYDDLGMWKVRWVVLPMIVAMVALCVGVGAFSNVISSGQCATYQQRYGLRSHWTMFYGCFLRLPNGHWIQSGNYQAFQQVHR